MANDSAINHPPAAARRISDWWGIILVLVLTFAVYSPTLRYQFVHDDRGQILENPAVRSWRAVPSYFTEHVWAGVMPDQHGNYYRPIFLVWLRINYSVFGNRAWGWHLTSILAHVLATFLVYLLVWRLGMGRDVAFLAALIFGIHPVHIEGVAWISGVTEPLLGVFLIASFLAYVRSRREAANAFTWRFISLLLFALAMLEKETGLILPGLLVLYEWIFGEKPSQRFEGRKFITWCGDALGRLWPYFLLVVLYVPVRIHALKGFNHTVSPLSTAQLVATWPSLLAFWVRHLLWPASLSTYYNFPAVRDPTLRNFVSPAIFDLAVAVAVCIGARKSRSAAFFAAWLVLPLIPVLNLRVFVANDFAHDRYLYLPSVGLGVLVAMLLKKVCGGPRRWVGIPTSLFLVVVCLAAVMSYATATESFYFKDNLTFYAYNLTRAPHNPDAESNYASTLAESVQLGPALDAFLDAVNYNPTYWTPINNLALTYYKIGNLLAAEKYYLRAIQIEPNRPDEYFYLGMIRFKTGRTTEAIACLQRAIAIRSNGYAYHFALGMMRKTQGDLVGALQEFRQELANNPEEKGAVDQAREIEAQLNAQDRSGRPRSPNEPNSK